LRFSSGWNWIPDYGSGEVNEIEFRALFAYSPYCHLGVQNFPATMMTTADHDDRVVPAHLFKYAARLQEMQRGDAPILIRIATKSGHGASKHHEADRRDGGHQLILAAQS
jgi:prolyl oligopeptidase